MILLKKLKLNNFISHAKTEIDFAENDKILLDGNSGAGKSSIFDAIIWALYGQGRTDNRSIVRKGTKAGFVILELIDGETTYRIKRGMAVGGKHTLEVSTQKEGDTPKALPLNGIREIQAWIDRELIGASWLLFVNSVAYVQGNTESFVSQSAPKRKELLLEIVKAEDYRKYYEKARTTLSELENHHSMLDGQIIALRGVLPPLNARIKELGSIAGILSEKAAEEAKLKNELAGLTEKRDKYVESMREMVNITANLKTAIANRDFVEKMLMERREDVSQKEKILSVLEKAKDHDKKLETAREELTQLRDSFKKANELEAQRVALEAKKPVLVDRTSEVKRLNDKVTNLRNKPLCPSGDRCTYFRSVLLEISEMTHQINDISRLNSEEKIALDKWMEESDKLPPKINVNEIIDSISAKEESIKMLEVGSRKLESLTKEIENIEGIEKKIPEIQETLKEKQIYVNDLEAKKIEAEKTAKPKELVEVDEKIKTVADRITTTRDDIAKTTAKLESIEKDMAELKETESKIAELDKELASTKDKMSKVGLVKAAFSSKGGIETLVIDYLLPKLEDKINDILSKLSDFRVKLDTQKKASDGESIIEGLFITILNEENEELPFESYSGGEKLKISVAISEALATLQKVGFRLFDETFIGLDENSTESFVDVLNSLQKNFGQVLCISHLLQIKDLFDKKIVLIKNKNISYAK